jgi:hypothetical protein
MLSKDPSGLEVSEVEFDKMNRLAQRKYHHGQFNQELQKLNDLHQGMIPPIVIAVVKFSRTNREAEKEAPKRDRRFE